MNQLLIGVSQLPLLRHSIKSNVNMNEVTMMTSLAIAGHLKHFKHMNAKVFLQMCSTTKDEVVIFLINML